jgi:adenylate cyclase
MHGNIGLRVRLDFTVIGSALDMASRLEALTKQLDETVPLSRAFADLVEAGFDLERVGEYPVRGFNEPIDLLAYASRRPRPRPPAILPRLAPAR